MANVIFWPELPNDLPRPKLSAIELLNVNWFIEQHFFIVLNKHWTNSVMPGFNKRKNYRTRCFTHTLSPFVVAKPLFMSITKNYKNALGMWTECHAFRPITIIYTFIFFATISPKPECQTHKKCQYANRLSNWIFSFHANICHTNWQKKKQLKKKTQNFLLAPYFIFLCFGEFSEDF